MSSSRRARDPHLAPYCLPACAVPEGWEAVDLSSARSPSSPVSQSGHPLHVFGDRVCRLGPSVASASGRTSDLQSVSCAGQQVEAESATAHTLESTMIPPESRPGPHTTRNSLTSAALGQAARSSVTTPPDATGIEYRTRSRSNFDLSRERDHRRDRKECTHRAGFSRVYDSDFNLGMRARGRFGLLTWDYCSRAVSGSESDMFLQTSHVEVVSGWVKED